MNGFVCSRCQSPDLALARVIHDGGTVTTRALTESAGTHTSEFGGYAGHYSGSHETMGVGRTEMASRCAPPREPQPGVSAACVLGIPIFLWVLYATIPMRWKWDSLDLIFGGIAAYLMVVRAVMAYRESLQLAEYSEKLDRYERTCVCLRCGAAMILPPDWDRPNE